MHRDLTISYELRIPLSSVLTNLPRLAEWKSTGTGTDGYVDRYSRRGWRLHVAGEWLSKPDIVVRTRTCYGSDFYQDGRSLVWSCCFSTRFSTTASGRFWRSNSLFRLRKSVGPASRCFPSWHWMYSEAISFLLYVIILNWFELSELLLSRRAIETWAASIISQDQVSLVRHWL